MKQLKHLSHTLEQELRAVKLSNKDLHSTAHQRLNAQVEKLKKKHLVSVGPSFKLAKIQNSPIFLPSPHSLYIPSLTPLPLYSLPHPTPSILPPSPHSLYIPSLTPLPLYSLPHPTPSIFPPSPHSLYIPSLTPLPLYSLPHPTPSIFPPSPHSLYIPSLTPLPLYSPPTPSTSTG